MPQAPCFSVLRRLWHLVELLSAPPGLGRAELLDKLGVEDRTLGMDFTRLRKAGLRLRHRRSTGLYCLEWPEEIRPLRLTREQFFYMFYAAQTYREEEDGAEAGDLARRLALAVNGETDPVYDCGPAYGIGQGVTGSLIERFDILKDAIARQRKVVLSYASPGEDAGLRVIHPYRLLHTPVSWYMAAWCEERSEWRTFKLARIRELKLLRDRYTPRLFDLKAYLGDAWWIQKGPPEDPRHEVRALFTGEAAASILEYRLHPTQTASATPEGTLVTWKLSYLGECATWLMQWLGQVRILGPDSLREEIEERLARHQALNPGTLPLAQCAEPSGGYSSETQKKNS